MKTLLNIRTIVLLLTVGLLACSSAEPIHGAVVSKDHHPQIVMFIPISTPCGKSTCMIMVPMIFPESWSVAVQGPDASGKTVTRDIYVTHQQWELVRAGDQFICGGDQHQACVTERPRRRAE